MPMGEREFETGKDESWAANMKMLFDFSLANMKRTYDEYQNASLKVGSDAQSHFNDVQNISTQALQNAVETANMVGKQAVRHGDIAIDRQWNIDEVAHLISHTPIFKDAISAAVVSAMAEALKSK